MFTDSRVTKTSGDAMANRRQVLKWAAAASAATTGALSLRLSSAAPREARSGVELFVFDRRFAAARAAAARNAAAWG